MPFISITNVSHNNHCFKYFLNDHNQKCDERKDHVVCSESNCSMFHCQDNPRFHMKPLSRLTYKSFSYCYNSVRDKPSRSRRNLGSVHSFCRYQHQSKVVEGIFATWERHSRLEVPLYHHQHSRRHRWNQHFHNVNMSNISCPVKCRLLPISDSIHVSTVLNQHFHNVNMSFLSCDAKCRPFVFETALVSTVLNQYFRNVTCQKSLMWRGSNCPYWQHSRRYRSESTLSQRQHVHLELSKYAAVLLVINSIYGTILKEPFTTSTCPSSAAMWSAVLCI